MKTLDQHNSERHKAHAMVADPHNGIACPQCGKELLDSNPDEMLISNPPQMRTRCEFCNYRGLRLS